MNFFGLNFDYRQQLFEQIHEICFYGQGGYSWDIVYNWPIWLRRFTYNKIIKHYKALKEGDEQTLTAETDPSKLIPLPKIDDPRNKTIHYKSPKK